MNRLTIVAIAMAMSAPTFVAADDTLDNAAKEKGAVKTASGMVYRSIKDGTGASPTASSVVVVDYRGTLPNGYEFDSSYKSKLVTRFSLSDVIPCWREGVRMMKVGGKAQFVCPPELAYGSRGAGRDIPPNSTLIFEVDLINVE